MNKVILVGRLTRDPEIRYSQGATSTVIARFSIAVDRKYKREGEATADFFNCVAFGKQAEFIERYLHKGIKIILGGNIQNNNYTNREGQTVHSVNIMVEEIEFAESKAASGETGYTTFAGRPEPSTSNNGFMNIPEDFEEELPF